MKQSKAIFKDYQMILSGKNCTLEDSDIHQFTFRNRRQNAFHYSMMEERISVLIYDTHNDDSSDSAGKMRDPLYGNVFITLKKGDSSIERLKALCKLYGGEYCGTVTLI